MYLNDFLAGCQSSVLISKLVKASKYWPDTRCINFNFTDGDSSRVLDPELVNAKLYKFFQIIIETDKYECTEDFGG